MLGADDGGGVGGEGEGGGRSQEGHSGREVCPNGRASRGHDACPGTCPRLARRRWRLWRVAARALDAAREVAAQSRTRALLAQITSTPSPGILAGASSRVALGLREAMASSSALYSVTPWEISFLDPLRQSRNALIVLNQPFSFALLHRVWHASRWHACADGGANRLHDLLRDYDGKDLRHL